MSPLSTRTFSSLTVVLLVAHCAGAFGYGAKIRVGFLGRAERIPYADSILRQAGRQLKLDGVVPSDIQFEYVFAEGCDVKADVLLKTKDLFGDNNVDVLIGPECSAGMEIAALVAYAFQRPIFGYGSVSDELSDKDTYATLARISKTMSSMGAGVNQLLKYFGWGNVAVIHDASTVCDIALSGILSEIANKSSAFHVSAQIATDSIPAIKNALKTVRSVSRIIILCYGWDPSTADTFLLEANEANMNSPDYVYILPYFLKLSAERPWPWEDQSLNASDRDGLLRMYRNVLVIQTTGDDASTLTQFRRYLMSNNVRLDWVNATAETLLPVIFDALYLYGMALNRTVSRGGNISNGVEIREACRFLTFTGKSGKITMNKWSERVSDYTVFSTNATNDMNPLLSIPAILVQENNSVSRHPSLLRSETFLTPDGRHPSDTPACGFNMETCITNYVNTVIAAACSVSAVALLAIALVAYYRKWRFEQSLIKMSWKLTLSDVKLLSHQARPSSGLWESRSKRTDSSSAVGISQMPEGDVFSAYASVRGVPAFAKCLRRQKVPVLRREQLLLMKQIKEMHQENVNQFLGAVIDDGPYVMGFWKYAAKGSLLDVVMKEDIHLDDTFVASILKDVVLGLEYIHKSPIHYHGTLNVSNCVVDSRWIVKLTDFGWVQFQEHLKASDVLFFEETLTPQKMCHIAPEVLRKTVDSKTPNYCAVMRAADVYSLAFIIYHVIYRSEPIYDNVLTPDDVTQRIKKTGVDPLRPHALQDLNADPNLVALMHRCWCEDPRERPAIAEIKSTFTNIFGDIMKSSLLDHMMSILEKYATNLEKVVEERTQQLEAERRRADQLLYQMLPRSVADLLKGGLSVEPESYECVTIYFSDIVGFTALSSDSTPMEVVTMLNKLYSEFDKALLIYDVYKVETIGDAYMVVSGLPRRNDDKHVTEICDMALSILNLVYCFQVPHRPDHRLRVRIGIHSGPVAAGVVGQTMPRFCLFGDTVNTASRMESNGEPSKIHISGSTASLLRSWREYVIQLRGNVTLKGKGLVTTYWLIEKRAVIPGEVQ